MTRSCCVGPPWLRLPWGRSCRASHGFPPARASSPPCSPECDLSSPCPAFTQLLDPAAGTNRALLCKSTVDGLQVTQLNVDHTTENEDELFRLSQLGERGQWRARGARPRWPWRGVCEVRGLCSGLGTSLPGAELQLCGFPAGDVWP